MMMSQIADALDARLYGPDVMMTGVSKDTRDLHHGDLYVALVGERFDGHEFVEQAGLAGAAGALVSELRNPPQAGLPQVKVNDTRLALGRLAAHWRNTWSHENPGSKLIGITGSNGKTSVKEMCRKILTDFAGAQAVLSTRGNLNNDIGLPMMLLELRPRHRFAVIEMGANHVGEIDYLTTIAKPDVAVVNNVGPAHLEGFGSLENIAKAKAEIFNGLSAAGVAVINLDDNFSSYWQEYIKNICVAGKLAGFSMQDDSADVYARHVSANRYMLTAFNEQAELTLKVPGKHNVMNALAAITVTRLLDVPLDSIVSSLSEFVNIKGRLTVLDSPAGFKVIDDTYNANPLSVAAAIDVLADMPGNTVLVLGDMAELGDDVQQLHADIGNTAKCAGIKALYASGQYSKYTVEAFGENGFWFAQKNELIAALTQALTAGDIVLVKGSRSAVMEEVVEQILTRTNNNKRVN